MYYSVSNECDAITSQCICKPNMYGLTCKDPEDGWYCPTPGETKGNICISIKYCLKNGIFHAGRWEIPILRRVFHFYVLEPRRSKHEKMKNQNWSWYIETKLAAPAWNIYSFNNCHFNFGEWPCNFKSQLKRPILETNSQIKVASVMYK